MSRTNGKTNLFKNSLYLPCLSPQELAAVRKAPLRELEQEIQLLRVAIKRLMETGKNKEDLDTQTSIARSLSQLVTALNAALKTLGELEGSRSPLDEALERALQAEPFYLDAPTPAPPEEPVGEEAERWRLIFAVNPTRPDGPRRRR